MKPAKPGFWRYLAIISYDLLILLAILFFATFIILPLNSGVAFTRGQFLYPIYLLSVSFLYYGWCWTHGGQTIGLKTWKTRVLTFSGENITWRHAFIRFIAALFSFACLGIGVFWLLIDKDKRTWHDIISKTEVFCLRKFSHD